MNGRIYDPVIGRFMSADPYIQFPDNLQSFNRYTYLMNNPLAGTDPSGFDACGPAFDGPDAAYCAGNIIKDFFNWIGNLFGGGGSGSGSSGDAGSAGSGGNPSWGSNFGPWHQNSSGDLQRSFDPTEGGWGVQASRNAETPTFKYEGSTFPSGILPTNNGGYGGGSLQELRSACEGGSLGACSRHNDLAAETGALRGPYLPSVLKDLAKEVGIQLATAPLGIVKFGAKGVGAIEGAVSQGARTEARTLAEQLSLKEARAGAGERIMQGKINDPKFPADEWAKMQHVHTTPEGQNIVIHYWERTVDALRTGFKFKD